LLRADYLNSVLILEECCKKDNKSKSFAKAFEKLLNCYSFGVILNELKTVPKFNEILNAKENLVNYMSEEINFINNTQFDYLKIGQSVVYEGKETMLNVLGKRNI
jgi:flagellar biosynthesis regulator FlbT